MLKHNITNDQAVSLLIECLIIVTSICLIILFFCCCKSTISCPSGNCDKKAVVTVDAGALDDWCPVGTVVRDGGSCDVVN